MLRSAPFSQFRPEQPANGARLRRAWQGGLVCALLALAVLNAQPPGMVREGDRFRRDFYGSHPAARRLRINAHGPVTLQSGAGSTVAYVVSVTVRARSEAEARRVLERYSVHAETVGDRVVLTA